MARGIGTDLPELRRFYRESDYALAMFFGVTLLEEIAKGVLLAARALGKEVDRSTFYSHSERYLITAYATLMDTSRITRVYGADEDKFARWLREGRLLQIRNQALHLDLHGERARTPAEAVSREDAFLVVCIAGEAYAEIQGYYTATGPDEWQRISDEIDTFRAEVLAE